MGLGSAEFGERAPSRTLRRHDLGRDDRGLAEPSILDKGLWVSLPAWAATPDIDNDQEEGSSQASDSPNTASRCDLVTSQPGRQRACFQATATSFLTGNYRIVPTFLGITCMIDLDL